MTAPLTHTLTWQEAGQTQQVRWQSSAGWPPPKRLELADQHLPAQRILSLFSEGVGVLWRGELAGARQLLATVERRLDSKPLPPAPDLRTAFHQLRKQQGERARLLGRLVVEVGPGQRLRLRRPPDASAALTAVLGPNDAPYALSVRELLGYLGAWQWQQTGVAVPQLGPAARIYPRWGVFAPVRGEYLQLVADAPLPPGCQRALDVGTGTGVLAAIVARRGVPQVVATETNPLAVACARDNLQQLGLDHQVQVQEAAWYGAQTEPFDLIVCNPPWLPAKPTSLLETAVFDPDSQMLRGLLTTVAARLKASGQAWLVLSDLAERLGLRTDAELQNWIAAGGLRVVAVHAALPSHKKTRDAADPLAQARSAEVTRLFCLQRITQ